MPEALLDRFIKRKSLSMTPDALVTLRSLESPPQPVYGSSVFDVMSTGYGALYRTQPAVRICVSFIARNVAQLNVKTYRRNANEDRRELPDHKAAKALRDPNKYTTKFRLMFATIADLGIYENAFWLKMREGEQLALVRIPPECVKISGPQWVKPTEYVVMPTRMFGIQDEIRVKPDDMIHFRGYDPLDARMGASPLIALQAILMEDLESRRYRRKFWRKAARMEGIIERPLDAPDWDEDSVKRFKIDWQNATTGVEHSGETAVLEEGMSFKAHSFSPKDAEWIAGRKLTLEEAARAYHIPPTMLGLNAGPTQGAVTEEHKMLYQDCLGPTLEMIEQDLRLQLLPEFDDIENVYFEFNLMDKLKGSFEENATLLTTAVGGPWLTTNEARSRVNLPRKDDGDELIVPMNVTKGGQPAPTVPTQVPGGPIPAEDQAKPPKAMKQRDHAVFMRTKREEFVTEADQVLRRAFTDQRDGKGFDRAKLDRRLASDLWAVSVKTAAYFGEDAADRIGGSYNEQRTHNFLMRNSEIAAAGINEVTEAALAEADRAKVFDVAINSRAITLAIERTTFAMNFGAMEAAKQNGG